MSDTDDEITARRKAAAARALAEAAERRRADESRTPPATELGGRKGPEPTRYGDWENKGIAVDF